MTEFFRDENSWPEARLELDLADNGGKHVGGFFGSLVGLDLLLLSFGSFVLI
jgi:hypothetical protein